MRSSDDNLHNLQIDFSSALNSGVRYTDRIYSAMYFFLILCYGFEMHGSFGPVNPENVDAHLRRCRHHHKALGVRLLPWAYMDLAVRGIFHLRWWLLKGLAA